MRSGDEKTQRLLPRTMGNSDGLCFLPGQRNEGSPSTLSQLRVLAKY